MWVKTPELSPKLGRENKCPASVWCDICELSKLLQCQKFSSSVYRRKSFYFCVMWFQGCGLLHVGPTSYNRPDPTFSKFVTTQLNTSVVTRSRQRKQTNAWIVDLMRHRGIVCCIHEFLRAPYLCQDSKPSSKLSLLGEKVLAAIWMKNECS